MAIAWYMAIDGEAWELTIKEIPNGQHNLKHWLSTTGLSVIEKLYGDRRFVIAEIAMSDLQQCVMQDPEILENWDSWKDYHQWYIQAADDIPSHSSRNPWPVILASTHKETIEDGWHRFHRYSQIGMNTIPCIIFI